jgi:hypothetical protein
MLINLSEIKCISFVLSFLFQLCFLLYSILFSYLYSLFIFLSSFFLLLLSFFVFSFIIIYPPFLPCSFIIFSFFIFSLLCLLFSFILFLCIYFVLGGTRSWLRHYATRRKVADSIPDNVMGLFNSPNPSSRTIALGSTQPLTEMSTRNLSGGKGRPACSTYNLTSIYEPID